MTGRTHFTGQISIESKVEGRKEGGSGSEFEVK